MTICVELTEAEVADLEAVRLDRSLDDYLLYAALQWARSVHGRYEAYVDSGRAEADEAAEWADAVREWEHTRQAQEEDR